jgi:hypothetical protein
LSSQESLAFAKLSSGAEGRTRTATGAIEMGVLGKKSQNIGFVPTNISQKLLISESAFITAEIVPAFFLNCVINIGIYNNYQEPQRIVLGVKEGFKRKNGMMSPTPKNDEAYYISLLDSLQQLLNDEFVLAEVRRTVASYITTSSTAPSARRHWGRGNEVILFKT